MIDLFSIFSENNVSLYCLCEFLFNLEQKSLYKLTIEVIYKGFVLN